MTFGFHGILPQTSAPYSPQQNGIAKRANRSIAEMARAMIYYQHLDREWWGEATQQEQERRVVLEEAEHTLQEEVEALHQEVAKLRAEKAESEKAAERFEAECVQARHDLVAQQTETSQFAQELATVLENYERYRRRSHTALKNVEKRAELLNGMRKENEEL
ncbi:hypothetical protein PsorP6_011815 [Peronosclerospora sorghi]|uniref:Uncharacterized protein n=1 Tax=Peronosclerospora sorghi TaxID=230839 RepID=A0ACC0WLE9_9STRA|nr:hypothetical protein PsorP6_011815 [Peronosclerospora sorghi]